MIKGGYYLKAKCVQESWIAKAPPHVREIWDLFLRKAFYKDGSGLKRGQLLITYSEIIEQLAWFVGYRKMTYKKHHCEIAMKALVKAAMITTTKTTRGVIVTVINYSKYQDFENYDCYTKRTTDTTGTLQPTDTIEKEVKEVKEETTDISIDEKANQCPHQKIVSLYNSVLGESLSPVKPKLWNGARRINLQARWKEDKDRQSIEWWSEYFRGVKDSDFLMGRVEGTGGKDPFRADMGWLIKQSNMVKVLEGKYNSKRKTDEYGRSK